MIIFCLSKDKSYGRNKAYNYRLIQRQNEKNYQLNNDTGQEGFKDAILRVLCEKKGPKN